MNPLTFPERLDYEHVERYLQMTTTFHDEVRNLEKGSSKCVIISHESSFNIIRNSSFTNHFVIQRCAVMR